MGYIYKVTNKINNCVYVGQTSKTLSKRWSQHIKESYEALDGTRKSFPYFHRAIIKYGVENFYPEVIEECDNNILDEREQYWIKYFNSYQNGYNATVGGQKLGKTNSLNSKAARKVIQYSIQGEFIQVYDKASIAAKAVGVDDSRVRDACNQKTKTSGGFQWRWYEENFPKIIGEVETPHTTGRKIIQYNLKGDQVHVYESIIEAAKINGYNYGNINRVLNQNSGTAYGYYWSYAECEPTLRKEKVEKPKQWEQKTHLSVAQYTKDGKFIKNFTSIKQASEETGIKTTAIRYVCEGKHKTTGGYHWEYIEI